MAQWSCSAAISLAVGSVLGLVSPGGVASDAPDLDVSDVRWALAYEMPLRSA